MDLRLSFDPDINNPLDHREKSTRYNIVSFSVEGHLSLGLDCT